MVGPEFGKQLWHVASTEADTPIFRDAWPVVAVADGLAQIEKTDGATASAMGLVAQRVPEFTATNVMKQEPGLIRMVSTKSHRRFRFADGKQVQPEVLRTLARIV